MHLEEALRVSRPKTLRALSELLAHAEPRSVTVLDARGVLQEWSIWKPGRRPYGAGNVPRPTRAAPSMGHGRVPRDRFRPRPRGIERSVLDCEGAHLRVIF